MRRRFAQPRLALLALASVMLSLLMARSTTAQTATFRNPLNSSGPDPWMQYYNGNYYLATTTWGGASTGLTMRRAPTIAGLKTATPVRIWQDSTAARCCNYWAPEFHLLSGPNGPRWYFYFSGGPATCCDNQRMHVLESAGTDPMGPYTYKGELRDSIGGWAIDHSVLQLNGALYLLFSAWAGDLQSIYIAPMSNPWTLSGNRVLLSSPTLPWERQGGNVNEGPVALQRNGRTFIIYSASACWGPDYKLGQLAYTGSNPLSTGAWTKSPNPVFQRSDANGVYAPGHNGFFKSPDGREDWIVYHANTSASGGCDMNRTTRIQKISWNADGTPNLGVPVSTSTDLPVPSGEVAPPPATSYQIVNRNSGKCLDVNGASTADGANVQQWICNGGNNQRWRVEDLGNGYSRLVNVRSGKVLDAANCGTADGTNIQQWSWLNNNCQQWRLLTTTAPYVRLENRNSGKVADVANCGTADGTNVRLWTWLNNNCQQWQLRP